LRYAESSLGRLKAAADLWKTMNVHEETTELGVLM